MNLNSMLSKTAKGVEEIETRKYHLDQRARTLLVVVNGKTPVAELVRKFEVMGDITPMFERLVAHGFIAETQAREETRTAEAAAPAANFQDMRAQLSMALLDALGPDGDSITAKLESCRSVQELKNYIDSKRPLLEPALGRRGEPFWKKAKELLG